MFRDEQGAELDAVVHEAATEFGIRGSKLGGSADESTLMTNLFSRFVKGITPRGLTARAAGTWIASPSGEICFQINGVPLGHRRQMR